MSAKAISPKTLTPIDLECPFFKVYHFIMLNNKQLKADEAQEIVDHIGECEACQSVNEEVKQALNCDSRASRAELITYLKCLMDQVTLLEEEAHSNYERKQRLKIRKRLLKAQIRIDQLEKQVAQLQEQVHELLKAAKPPTLKAPDDLECGDLEIHHFLMYLTNELSMEEKEQLVDHVRECKPCENAFDEVKNIFSCKKRPTRKEQLTFLSNLASTLWTSQVNKLKAELLIMKGASTNETN